MIQQKERMQYPPTTTTIKTVSIQIVMSVQMIFQGVKSEEYSSVTSPKVPKKKGPSLAYFPRAFSMWSREGSASNKKYSVVRNAKKTKMITNFTVQSQQPSLHKHVTSYL